MELEKDRRQLLGFSNLIIVVLSIYVLFAVAFDAFFTLSVETTRLLHFIDTIICFFFFFDFCHRFYNAKDKLKFMRWGWIDLLSSIPLIGILRTGRLFRLIQLFRVLRAFRSTKDVVNHIFQDKIQGTFTSAVIIGIILVIFSAIAILQVETAPNSNILSAEDAIWWAYVTMTTVGYGDKYPVTTEGRIIASLLMIGGAGIFGVFTAFLASWFVKGNKENDKEK